MASRSSSKLTAAAAMVASIFFLLLALLLSTPGSAAHPKKCGELHSPLPLCDGSEGGSGADACIAWCINEGYATGKCFGGDSGCTCLRLCAGDRPANGGRPAGGSMKAATAAP
ncbi:uncharacterized protein LOC107303634 [Oryza brachyantha]|uniref:uncharacterized protein LOC107303634 n=1 Tax=Oryza brachyantha TaxID=4533 RepID=UPI000776A781|nr:uncharacterized protein LOC107303634 [Oryza brachyantha]